MFKNYLCSNFLFDAPKDDGGTPPDQKEEKPDAQGKGGLSQEELNKEYAARAKRAAEAEKNRLYESIGVKSDDEFEAYLKAKKEADDKNKTELQKAQEDARDWQTKFEKLEADKKAVEISLTKRVQDTEIKIAALAEVAEKDKDGKVTKVIRPAFLPAAMDEVLLLLDRSKIAEKDGKVTGIDEALDALAKAKSHLLATSKTTAPQGKGSPLPQSGRLPKAPRPDHEDDGLGFESL